MEFTGYVKLEADLREAAAIQKGATLSKNGKFQWVGMILVCCKNLPSAQTGPSYLAASHLGIDQSKTPNEIAGLAACYISGIYRGPLAVIAVPHPKTEKQP